MKHHHTTTTYNRFSKLLCILPLSFCLSNAFQMIDAPDFVRNTPNSQQKSILSYHDSIKNATKAVVNITTEKKIGTSANPFFSDPFFQQFFGNMMPQDKLQGDIGSGVIISSDGYIVTNSHVVRGADKIYVTLPGSSKRYLAKLIGEDTQSDIAVIRIDKTNLPVLPFADSSKYAVGDVVFAIGNPFGVGESVTQGIISAMNKTGFGINNYENFIQTDASINPGNSGGALIDSRGAFIGMNTAIISRTGGNHGIGFAIPSEMIKSVVAELIKTGKVKRGFLGINIKDVGSDVAEIYSDVNGALVVGMQADSPAKRAGLAVWDVITEVNGKKVKSAAELRNIIGSLPPRERVVITFLRSTNKDGKQTIETKQANVILAEQPQQLTEQSFDSSSPEFTQNGGLFDGVKVDNLTPQIRQNYRIPDEINGVVISDIANNSRASNVGFAKGDIIAQIEDVQIKNISDFQKALSTFSKSAKRILAYNILTGEVKTIIAK